MRLLYLYTRNSFSLKGCLYIDTGLNWMLLLLKTKTNFWTGNGMVGKLKRWIMRKAYPCDDVIKPTLWSRWYRTHQSTPGLDRTPNLWIGNSNFFEKCYCSGRCCSRWWSDWWSEKQCPDCYIEPPHHRVLQGVIGLNMTTSWYDVISVLLLCGETTSNGVPSNL